MVSFLFACFLFCLRGFFFVCSASLVGHRTNRPIQPIKSNATLTFQVFGLAVRIKESKDSSRTKTFPSAAGIGAGVT